MQTPEIFVYSARMKPLRIGLTHYLKSQQITMDDRAHRRTLSRDGRVMEVLSAHVPGWLEGYLLTAPWLLLLLRSLHPHRGFHVQSARKWLKVTRDIHGAARSLL